MCSPVVPWCPPPAAWTLGNKQLCLVCVAGCALEQCLPELRVQGVCAPAPGDVGSPRTLTDLNSLLLFMALCCFSVPQLLSVSFSPQAASVARP